MPPRRSAGWQCHARGRWSGRGCRPGRDRRPAPPPARPQLRRTLRRPGGPAGRAPAHRLDAPAQAGGDLRRPGLRARTQKRQQPRLTRRHATHGDVDTVHRRPADQAGDDADGRRPDLDPAQCGARAPACSERPGVGAAVDQQVLRGDVAGVDRAQKRTELAELVGIAEAQRGDGVTCGLLDLRQRQVASLGSSGEVGRQPVGGEPAGQDIVDRHALAGHGPRHAADEAGQPGSERRWRDPARRSAP